MKRFWKWFKVPVEGTRVEVTKDYFADGDEYVNEANGFVKLKENYIEIKEKNDKEKKTEG